MLGVTNPDVIPGYELSPLDLDQVAAVEKHLEAQHLHTAELESVEMTAKQRQAIRQQASAAVATGLFCFGSPVFNKRMKAISLTPFLLWINLRIAKPGLTLLETKSLLKTASDGLFHRSQKFWNIHLAVLEVWGYREVDESEKKAMRNG